MWADALLELERGHLLRLALWAGGSALAGGVMLAWVMLRRLQAPFLRHFALQMFAWGVIDLAIVTWGWHRLALRDYAAAVELQQFLWLNVGLDAGYMGIGATLAIAGWRLGRRAGAVGAGVAIIVQGLALFMLDVRLLTIMGPPG